MISPFTNKLSKFFNWPAGQEFNLANCGEYLKQSWLSLLLFVLVVFALIWLTKQIIGMFKELFS